jgi:hypothetical protein
MTERKPPGMPFETWVDHQISQGMARGDFTALQGTGKPLPRRSAADDAYEWVVEKARREGINTADMLPPGLALRRERDELPARVVNLPSAEAVRALAEDYNARVEAFWRRPQESRWSPVPGLADVEALVAGWRESRPPEPPPSSEPAPPAAARRSWFRARGRRTR